MWITREQNKRNSEDGLCDVPASGQKRRGRVHLQDFDALDAVKHAIERGYLWGQGA